jgi:hypothetical protein
VPVQRSFRHTDARGKRRRGDLFRLRFLQHRSQRLQDLRTAFAGSLTPRAQRELRMLLQARDNPSRALAHCLCDARDPMRQ